MRVGTFAFCHNTHNAIESHIFVALNTHTLCPVRCVFLVMLNAFSVREREHVPVSCVYRRPCVRCCVVCWSLFHSAILRNIF